MASNSTLALADDFDDYNAPFYGPERTLATIAAFVREHDGARAHVTRSGTVLVSDRDGAIRSVRTMRGAAEWLGY